ncbi:hypothetical protein SAMN03159463_05118 [Mesorhizobium sp. NFR06]|nr:hypothetical protein SAMN03159463_05118 [Mesorhizobium sp. NFR06]
MGSSSLLPLWEKVAPKATDEGCSRQRQRLTLLERPSSVSALRADPPSPQGEKEDSPQLRPFTRSPTMSYLPEIRIL